MDDGKLSSPPSSTLERTEQMVAEAPRATCDWHRRARLGTSMQPEHAHYRYLTCGYRDSCCF